MTATDPSVDIDGEWLEAFERERIDDLERGLMIAQDPEDELALCKAGFQARHRLQPIEAIVAHAQQITDEHKPVIFVGETHADIRKVLVDEVPGVEIRVFDIPEPWSSVATLLSWPGPSGADEAWCEMAHDLFCDLARDNERGDTEPDAEAVSARAESGEAFPAHLFGADHPIGRAVQAVLDQAEYPNPELAAIAAITAYAAIGGGRVEGRDRKGRKIRSNIYTAASAPSASGKSSAGDAMKDSMREAGLAKFIGPRTWKSDSGMVTSLASNPAQAVFLDEFGQLCMTLRDKRASSHIRGIVSNLLSFSSGGPVEPDAYAEQGKGTAISYAALSVSGVSTPEVMFGALGADAAEDGFLGRFIIFPVLGQAYGDERVGEQLAGLALDDVADDMKQYHEWLKSKVAQVVEKMKAAGRGMPLDATPHVLPMTDEAKQIAEEVKVEQTAQLRQGRVIWGRFGMNAGKLALIHAATRRQDAIDADAMRWGVTLARWSLSTLALAMSQNDGKTDYAKLVDKVSAKLKKLAGKKKRKPMAAGVSAGAMAKAIGESAERAAALMNELVERGLARHGPLNRHSRRTWLPQASRESRNESR